MAPSTWSDTLDTSTSTSPQEMENIRLKGCVLALSPWVFGAVESHRRARGGVLLLRALQECVFMATAVELKRGNGRVSIAWHSPTPENPDQFSSLDGPVRLFVSVSAMWLIKRKWQMKCSLGCHLTIALY